jgi:hypothetical protein
MTKWPYRVRALYIIECGHVLLQVKFNVRGGGDILGGVLIKRRDEALVGRDPEH